MGAEPISSDFEAALSLSPATRLLLDRIRRRTGRALRAKGINKIAPAIRVVGSGTTVRRSIIAPPALAVIVTVSAEVKAEPRFAVYSHQPTPVTGTTGESVPDSPPPPTAVAARTPVIDEDTSESDPSEESADADEDQPAPKKKGKGGRGAKKGQKEDAAEADNTKQQSLENLKKPEAPKASP